MNILLDSRILGRESVCVKSDREEDIVALHSSLTGNYLKARISLDVTNVHTVTRGVREFYQTVELLLAVVVRSLECVMFVPVFLPFGFNRFIVISAHLYHSFAKFNFIFCRINPAIHW